MANGMKKQKTENPFLNGAKTGAVRGALGRQQYVAVVAMLSLLIVITLFASYGILNLMERRAHASAEKLVSQLVDHIDTRMNEVRTATRAASETAYAHLDDPEALEQLVYDFVKENSFVYGSTVAFEPDRFPERGRCFAPYSWQEDNTVFSRQLGTETDYYEEEWYAETKLSGAEYWCEPYFDEGGAKITMCTFSVPLFQADGTLAAVMTADVGLEDLKEYITSIRPYPDSFIVLRSRKGAPLVNGETDSVPGNGTTFIKGMTDIGWSVELVIPLNYLIHGDTGIFFLVGFIFLITILFVLFINRLLRMLQQRSTAEYMNVIDAISSGFTSIYLVDLNTDETFTFRDPSGYESVIGAPGNNTDFQEKLRRLIAFDGHSADRERMRQEIEPETIRAHLAGQDRYEVRFRKLLDGGVNWHEMHVFAMDRDEQGVPLNAVIAFRDVNESVKKEKETQQTLEQALNTAQSASKAKTDFLFNMSHDIRTPMNAIIGFTNMAMKHIDDKERVKDSLVKTQEASELLLSLINDILDMSRIESGKIQLEENEGDVMLSFVNIESTMRELAKTKDISLSFSYGRIKDRYVYADFSRCIRVFVNIISNAIKYTGVGGTVKVTCEQTESKNGLGVYRYTFEDNGIGMSEEFQKRMFDEFAREETSTVSGIQGTGLGLAVCRTFVHAMNGTIECRSKQGVGSTFIVTLPFRLQQGELFTDPVSGLVTSEKDAALNAAREIDYSGRRVLLVEDNEMNREIAEEILSEEGMIVETAADGSLAVQLLKEKGPDWYDFILMDIQMPIMNGYEATKEIRSMYPKAALPIIALSANAFDEDKIASITAGMNDHVAKPLNIAVLKETMAKYLKPAP